MEEDELLTVYGRMPGKFIPAPKLAMSYEENADNGDQGQEPDNERNSCDPSEAPTSAAASFRRPIRRDA